MNQLERQVMDTKKMNIEDRVMMDELRRNHENLNKELSKQQGTHHKIMDAISQKDRLVEEKEKDIFDRQIEVDKRNKQM